MGNYALVMFFMGVVTPLAEWDSIRAKLWQKVLHLITFLAFMLPYVPIAMVALFRRSQWKPIVQSADLSIEDLM